MSVSSDQPTPVPESTGISQDSLDDAVKGADQIERRFRKLIHEMAGLLDGSLRSVQLAKQSEAASAPALETAERGLTAMIGLLKEARERPESLDETIGSTAIIGTTLRESIWDAIELLRPAAKARGIAITSELHRNLAGAAPLPIFPVVSNAIRNAIEASVCNPGERAIVHISAHLDIKSNALLLRVRDEGEGLVTENDISPFEEGFTTKDSGMGLGLAICQQIVETLGGQVSLTNRTDGIRGCVFTLEVPAQTQHVGSAA